MTFSHLTPDFSEQHWLAARYVWGELPVDECVAFEEQLASDPQLCVLVGEITVLLETIRVAETMAVVDVAVRPGNAPRVGSRPLPPQQSLGQWGAIAACLLTLVVGWWSWSSVQHVPPVAVVEVPDEGFIETESEVLLAWTRLIPESDDRMEVVDPMGDEEPAEAVNVPDWLLTAVAAAPEEDSVEAANPAGDGT